MRWVVWKWPRELCVCDLSGGVREPFAIAITLAGWLAGWLAGCEVGKGWYEGSKAREIPINKKLKSAGTTACWWQKIKKENKTRASGCCTCSHLGGGGYSKIYIYICYEKA